MVRKRASWTEFRDGCLVGIVPLTQGKYAIIDVEYLETINKYNWFFHHGYAVRRTGDQMIQMHRVINKTQDGLLTDHINQDRSDNRKANLRSCNHAQNIRNGKPRGGSSFYHGVYWNKEKKAWQVSIRNNCGKKIYLGRFASEHAAALKYNDSALLFHGEYAKLNAVKAVI